MFVSNAHYKHNLLFKISVLIMREKVISSMMAVNKEPEISVKMSAGE